MKKLTALLTQILALLLFSATLQAAPAFEEGEFYKPITPPQRGAEGDRVQVIEFFLYTCPHCYRLEPHVKKWLESKPEYVDFVRIPAMFPRPQLIMHAKTYYALELMGAEQKVHDAIYDAIHEKRMKLKTQAEVEQVLDGLGVDIEQYRKAMNSFAVQANVKRAERLLTRFNVRGVPAVIVDGKYVTSGLRGDVQMQVTDFLIDKVKKEKSAN